ncbi:MAG: M18 family aminopeptidase [Candidatus Dormibacteria bacterium]
MEPLREALGLIEFTDASPSPYHACATAAAMLQSHGFERLSERQSWPAGGNQLIVRGGTLIAWSVPEGVAPGSGVCMVGAHTDSPNLRIRPRPERQQLGYRQLAVDVYGGALVNSWLDRDLGISGRVVVETASGPEVRLLRVDRALLRVAQLAPHLDRDLRAEGLHLNAQTQVVPILGMAAENGPDFLDLMASDLGVGKESITSWDLMTHDLAPGRLAGQSNEFVSAARLDNLGCSYAATRAMIDGLGSDTEAHRISILCLFDHEEVGSTTSTGAAGGMLPATLERITLALGWTREDFLRSMSQSTLVSADMGHAVHPNYQDHYEPGHLLHLNQGPAIKVNANQRYATDAVGDALFAACCRDASVPWQHYLGRADMPCGSTIGPMLSARLGVTTVDVGFAQLAMHSARELCGAEDVSAMVRALTAFLGS